MITVDGLSPEEYSTLRSKAVEGSPELEYAIVRAESIIDELQGWVDIIEAKQ